MNVGLMGFGKTGRAVASVLLESKDTNLRWVVRQSSQLNHRSAPEVLGTDSDEPGVIYSRDEVTASELFERDPVDVIIDFSSEEGLDYYADVAVARTATVISAVSHYPDRQIDRLRHMARRTRVMHSPNITLGINFLIVAAKVLKNIAPYTDIEIIEEHFKGKSEVSGTAKVIARELGLQEDGIKAVRAGTIVGVHEILFGFPFQTVRLKHESISREAFGNGILFAVSVLKDKPRGFYTMEDLLLPFFRLHDDEDDIPVAKKKAWWQFGRT